MKTAEGAKAYALYKSEGSELPWPQYVEKATRYRLPQGAGIVQPVSDQASG